MAVVFVAAALCDLLWRPTVPKAPEIRLSRFVQAADHDNPPPNSDDWLIGGVFAFQEQMWDAIFEIRNPPESGILLSHDQIEVELLGADGQWTTKPLPQRTALWLFEAPLPAAVGYFTVR
jgi:hypothetical protein